MALTLKLAMPCPFPCTGRGAARNFPARCNQSQPHQAVAHQSAAHLILTLTPGLTSSAASSGLDQGPDLRRQLHVGEHRGRAAQLPRRLDLGLGVADVHEAAAHKAGAQQREPAAAGRVAHGRVCHQRHVRARQPVHHCWVDDLRGQQLVPVRRHEHLVAGAVRQRVLLLIAAAVTVAVAAAFTTTIGTGSTPQPLAGRRVAGHDAGRAGQPVVVGQQPVVLVAQLGAVQQVLALVQPEHDEVHVAVERPLARGGARLADLVQQCQAWLVLALNLDQQRITHMDDSGSATAHLELHGHYFSSLITLDRG
eukprot:CAMPEP_0202871354 /NCGR_PEP_ID=MMETSP1391-20130828/18460_1 /ASSEMBLY_ACC=CAM_ASM_000867 /TAXON_ID=1034604 /ORGANISM="Chlamydomonas leiostraca, Strain SAG 11-49" /LENGTH=308 /DNA_ID=CAMNT_0049552123 /DNA_START=254 /DNA_END=1177 /DNA_ORIENTATION=+